MGSDDGTFSQEYFVYCKKKFLNQGANYPSDAADVLCGVALIKRAEKDRTTDTVVSCVVFLFAPLDDVTQKLFFFNNP